MADKTIYRLNDEISFRKCSLFDGDQLTFGDCTNFSTAERNWRTYYCCNQDGIHFHCTAHPEIELEIDTSNYYTSTYCCPKCQKSIEIENVKELKSKCLRMLNIPAFKDATLVRLDDWYVHEIKEKEKKNLVIGLQQMLKQIKTVTPSSWFMLDIRTPVRKHNFLSSQKKDNLQAITRIWTQQRSFQKSRFILR